MGPMFSCHPIRELVESSVPCLKSLSNGDELSSSSRAFRSIGRGPEIEKQTVSGYATRGGLSSVGSPDGAFSWMWISDPDETWQKGK